MPYEKGTLILTSTHILCTPSNLLFRYLEPSGKLWVYGFGLGLGDQSGNAFEWSALDCNFDEYCITLRWGEVLFMELFGLRFSMMLMQARRYDDMKVSSCMVIQTLMSIKNYTIVQSD